MTKISNPEVAIINVYRSKNASSYFISELEDLIESEQTVVICGDFNFCCKEEKKHPVLKFLISKMFKQMVQGSTHIEGRCLDHVYVRMAKGSLSEGITTTIGCCYYSDHHKVVTLLKN